MKKVLNRNFEAGSKKSNEPRLLGSIVNEMLHSDSPLAKGYRQYIASHENEETSVESEPARLFEDIYPHTELDVDLKLFTLKPGRVNEGEFLPGMLTRDGEDHFSFVENASERKKVVTRNPRVYSGRYVNVSQQDDGSMYPNFNRPRYSENFSFKDLCREASAELLVVAGLVGE